MRRGLHDLLGAGTSESWLLLGDLRLDTFAFEHEGQKHRLARTFLIRRQARQPVAAVDQFVDG